MDGIEYIESPSNINLPGTGYSISGEDIFSLKIMLSNGYKFKPIIFGIATDDITVYNESNLNSKFNDVIPKNQLFLLLSKKNDIYSNIWQKVFYKKGNRYYIGRIRSSKIKIKTTTSLSDRLCTGCKRRSLSSCTKFILNDYRK